MGYGPIFNGKQTPITPWLGSWAQREAARRMAPNRQWPLGCSVKQATPLTRTQRLEDASILKAAEYYHQI